MSAACSHPHDRILQSNMPVSHDGAMRKSITSDEYAAITDGLRQMRQEAALTQPQLAERLNRPSSLLNSVALAAREA